ncbi:transcriptional regulator [Pseudoalteromonas sp. JBTF-M23]|uniref:Transcriptional regulator n=1 Tax=Pseudoalteromonas caenipelagi TaxID=2726988 RepID=A0A849VII6_9GAMM|nr:helix-turn-helix domain-containing protein [Pseudoalteromonas caenipelagi]NOU53125.1 transcriptional regulator [Pseudoalteromonas caenipelagi]
MKPNEIKQAISNKGYSLSMIADALKVAPSAVSNVVNGNARSERIAKAIAKLLEKPLKSVFPDIYSSSSQPKVVKKGEQREKCVVELRQLFAVAS